MNSVDLDDQDGLNKIFCDTIGKSTIKAVLLDLETNEKRTYISKSNIYKHPKGWTNVNLLHLKNPYIQILLTHKIFINY